MADSKVGDAVAPGESGGVVGGRQKVSGADKAAQWLEVDVGPVMSVRADGLTLNTKRWNVIYGWASAKSDKEKRSVFAAVQLYMLKNGSSPAGEYTGEITASGRSFPASKIQALVGTGEGHVRRFLRGRLEDSVMCLKYSERARTDPEVTARGLSRGLAPEDCWLQADWLAGDNAYLTAREADIVARLKTANITRAAAQRGGASAVSGVERVPEPEVATPAGRWTSSQDAF